jgi:hypothetical protein
MIFYVMIYVKNTGIVLVLNAAQYIHGIKINE